MSDLLSFLYIKEMRMISKWPVLFLFLCAFLSSCTSPPSQQTNSPNTASSATSAQAKGSQRSSVKSSITNNSDENLKKLPTVSSFNLKARQYVDTHRKKSSITYGLQGAGCRAAVSGWKRILGDCNEKGQLQGFGVALQKNTLIAGDFIHGLPHGQTAILWLNTTLLSEKSDPYSLVRSGDGFDCVVEMINGRLGNQMMCKDSVIVTPSSTTSRLDFITSNIDNKEYWRIEGHDMNIDANWKQKLMSSESSVKFKASNLTVTFDIKHQTKLFMMETSKFKTKAEIHRKNLNVASIEGNFIFSTHGSGGGLRFEGLDLKSFNAKSGQSVLVAHKDKMYSATYFEKKFDVVFLFAEYGDLFALYGDEFAGGASVKLQVAYLKDDAIEFDTGRYERCDSKAAGAIIEYFKYDRAINNKYPDVKFTPRCGYLKDNKSGKEYFGYFDEKGKPIGRY
jgi:hypothetical protein